MRIGLPKEIKPQEYRVGLTPSNVEVLIINRHKILIESNGGIGSDFTRGDYIKSAVIIINNVEEIFEEVDLIIKVKEPQQQEYTILRKALMIFAYLHLATDSEQTRLLLESEAIAIAYETVTDDFHTLLLLAPMWAIAGRLVVQVVSRCLEKSTGGRGILLSGVHGTTLLARVLIIRGVIVGVNSARMAMGLGANVTILDISLDRIRKLNDMYTPKLTPLYLIKSTIYEHASNVARIAIIALNNATLRFILLLVGNNYDKTLAKDHHLHNGLSMHYNSVTNKVVADSLNYQYHSPESVGLL